jgi:hypothetical protein
MKKIIIAISFISIHYITNAQTCEEREEKLLSTVGGFSAGLVYNTYGLIGSVADGYSKDAYSPETVSDLMNAQKKMADNLVKMIQGLINENSLKENRDKNYMLALMEVIQGLKKQAELLIDYSTTNSGQKQRAYEEQRKKSWSAISKLMGIEE